MENKQTTKQKSNNKNLYHFNLIAWSRFGRKLPLLGKFCCFIRCKIILIECHST